MIHYGSNIVLVCIINHTLIREPAIDLKSDLGKAMDGYTVRIERGRFLGTEKVQVLELLPGLSVVIILDPEWVYLNCPVLSIIRILG